MSGAIAGASAVIGAFFMLVAAIGVVRFKDTFARLHCAGKSATLGIAFMLLSAAIWSGDAWVAVRCLLAAVFFLLTGPIGCHAIARAVWRTRPAGSAGEESLEGAAVAPERADR
ncbi:MAG: monovalent cation/H(+) antiporter subunit G [Acidobacteria bacterium]|nr:monovalent cation/H(+) antiporter subunit G [Acidobacteriota bacterium]MCG3191991.1 hypothetical protein [Thermoanaerobaculia bacterium]MCK6683691.1 monovalent cation/H(+) antiporter subunit G [Thermoanaerobaculia bacterium]